MMCALARRNLRSVLLASDSMHAAPKYRRAEGQRYIWKHAWGRADYFWEGTAHYTNFGGTPNWQRFIAELNPRQRELFRLPAPGHDYYTEESLAALEVMYPGFDRDGVYAAAMAIENIEGK